jgi:hypothetical protein
LVSKHEKLCNFSASSVFMKVLKVIFRSFIWVIELLCSRHCCIRPHTFAAFNSRHYFCLLDNRSYLEVLKRAILQW